MIVAGPASTHLAKKVASLSGLKNIELEHKLFPDGESYFRVRSQIDKDHIFVFQGTHPPQNSNLLQLMLIVDGLKGLGVRRVSAVVPYLAYARQDRRFLEGELVSLDTVLKMLKASGLDKILTFNIHSPKTLETSPIPVENLDATGLIASHLLQAGVHRPLVISPGKKGEEMASEVASILETDYAVVTTDRDRATGHVTVSLDADPRGREVVFVDDIISTGGTAIGAVQLCKARGAERVIVCCVHALLVDGADRKLMDSGASFVLATDTVPNEYGVASVSGLLAARLTRELS